jgi:hypothetical protein
MHCFLDIYRIPKRCDPGRADRRQFPFTKVKSFLPYGPNYYSHVYRISFFRPGDKPGVSLSRFGLLSHNPKCYLNGPIIERLWQGHVAVSAIFVGGTF